MGKYRDSTPRSHNRGSGRQKDRHGYREPYVRLTGSPKAQAVVQIFSEDAILRRYDSLARLLCPRSRATNCLAIAFVKDECIIAANKSHSLSEKDLMLILTNRMTIIKKFLQEVCRGSVDNSHGDKTKSLSVRFNEKTRILAQETVEKLMSVENGGCHSIAHQGRKRKTDQEHFVNALLKIARSCLLGIYTDGNRGFIKTELDVLLGEEGCGSIIVDQNHAEQAIANYLRFEQGQEVDGLRIGISKLCCHTCHQALSELGVIYRGTIGRVFPNVPNIITRKITNYSYVPDGDCFPEDSDSDCEFAADEVFIPDLEDVLSGQLDAAAAAEQPAVSQESALRYCDRYRVFGHHASRATAQAEAELPTVQVY